MGVCSGVTRSMHKTQCVHFPDLFSLWGGVESPLQTHRQNKMCIHSCKILGMPPRVRICVCVFCVITVI